MRRRPSRSMPPDPQFVDLSPPIAWLLMAVVLSPLGVFAWRLFASYEWLLGAVPAVALGSITLVLILSPGRRRLQAALVADLSAGSICRFARSFDCRQTDTWIIRAVFEALLLWRWQQGGLRPLHRTDRLWDDLRIDEEDLEDLVWTVARRCGRSRSGWLADAPTEVATVGDLVMHLNGCPRA